MRLGLVLAVSAVATTWAARMDPLSTIKPDWNSPTRQAEHEKLMRQVEEYRKAAAGGGVPNEAPVTKEAPVECKDENPSTHPAAPRTAVAMGGIIRKLRLPAAAVALGCTAWRMREARQAAQRAAVAAEVAAAEAAEAASQELRGRDEDLEEPSKRQRTSASAGETTAEASLEELQDKPAEARRAQSREASGQGESWGEPARSSARSPVEGYGMEAEGAAGREAYTEPGVLEDGEEHEEVAAASPTVEGMVDDDMRGVKLEVEKAEEAGDDRGRDGADEGEGGGGLEDEEE